MTIKSCLKGAAIAAMLIAPAAANAQYPTPPEPNYGPAQGSLQFKDTDPTEAIGGTLIMGRAVNEQGERINEADAGLTTYMVHWGLEVGEPGTDDDAGNGDLGGDCKGFRDTSNIGMVPATDDAEVLRMEIPQGTAVPTKAKYFVGHSIYGKIHNLKNASRSRSSLGQGIRRNLAAGCASPMPRADYARQDP